MMPHTVLSGIFPLPEPCRREILRYAGARTHAPELTALLEEALAEAAPALSGKVCWQEFPIVRRPDHLDLGFAQVQSASLEKNLAGCDRIILFAATVGLPLDRLIARYGILSPAKGLMLQAIGAERIEALCDVFCDHIRQEALCAGLRTAPRFSPGYGDLPLELQRDIFQSLDCARRIGLTLNDSLLMSPSKSVTAIVGLGPEAAGHPTTGCPSCPKTDCIHRRIP
ncbi:MAG: Vitamin B12 dependent methionine synthase activation subunit [Oscillospiraceae bacterium]|nr:Vitamin B12 dependent methionine synthase activation subunit [Oscillospiraceae bacterium]MBQ7130680.1 Vitamin B12 dependent methionine synthase activation subunit [Oscillospiraceae bacterium]